MLISLVRRNALRLLRPTSYELS